MTQHRTGRQLIEHAAQSADSLRIDEERGRINGVKVLGKQSKNGYEYSDAAQRDVLTLLEAGGTVFIDHRDEAATGCRPVDRHWGRIVEPTIRDGAVFGVLEYLKEHAATPSMIERARRFPNDFGLSIDAYGAVKNAVVANVERITSIDLVSRPATTAGLFESHTERRTMSKTVGELLAGKRDKNSVRLRKLLEEDSFEGMAEQPVADDPATPEDELLASIEAMCVAVIRNTSLDSAAKVARIKKILGVADKLADAAGGGDSAAAEPMVESLRAELATLKHRDTVRDLLEADGRAMADLTPTQRKLLLASTSEDAAAELLESFGPSATATAAAEPKAKPPVRPLRESSNNGRALSLTELIADAKASR